MDKGFVTFNDGALNQSGTRFYIREITDLNYAAIEAEMTALANAMAAITSTGFYKSGMSHTVEVGTPANAAGIRNLKWLVKWTAGSDPVEYGQHSIPCANMSLAVVQGDKWLLDDTQPEYTGLVSAFETTVETETGLAVSVYEIELTGRTL